MKAYAFFFLYQLFPVQVVHVGTSWPWETCSLISGEVLFGVSVLFSFAVGCNFGDLVWRMLGILFAFGTDGVKTALLKEVPCEMATLSRRRKTEVLRP